RLRFSGPKTSIICSPMTSLKTSIKTITYLSDIGCLEIQGASLLLIFIGSLLFRMSTMNCYNITIPNGRIPVAFLRSVKSRCGIFAGGITYKGGMDSTNRRNLQLAGLWRGFH
ncbi:hypothetical protein, partial [Escherichia coli]|uniref:hypothetical protein n=4 Tax=Escherichia coli TaxID=562 RepID=UPI002FC23A7F|nr:hypothetical protein [Escherichia coli]